LFNIQTGTHLLVAKVKKSRVKVKKLAPDYVEALGEAEINDSLYSNPEEDVQFLKNDVLPLQLEAIAIDALCTTRNSEVLKEVRYPTRGDMRKESDRHSESLPSTT
jgi:hypothetical protein